jgi:hypothetical protein
MGKYAHAGGGLNILRGIILRYTSVSKQEAELWLKNRKIIMHAAYCVLQGVRGLRVGLGTLPSAHCLCTALGTLSGALSSFADNCTLLGVRSFNWYTLGSVHILAHSCDMVACVQTPGGVRTCVKIEVLCRGSAELVCIFRYSPW